MRGANTFLFGRYFVSLTGWKERTSPFVLIPSWWFENGLEPDLVCRINRHTFGFARFRFQVDLGKVLFRPSDALDWDQSALPQWMGWAIRSGHPGVTKDQVVGLLSRRPDFMRIVLMDGISSHYGRLLFLEEVIQSGSVASHPDQPEDDQFGFSDFSV